MKIGNSRFWHSPSWALGINGFKRSVSAASNIRFLKPIDYIEVQKQKYLFGINGLNIFSQEYRTYELTPRRRRRWGRLGGSRRGSCPCTWACFSARSAQAGSFCKSARTVEGLERKKWSFSFTGAFTGWVTNVLHYCLLRPFSWRLSPTSKSMANLRATKFCVTSARLASTEVRLASSSTISLGAGAGRLLVSVHANSNAYERKEKGGNWISWWTSDIPSLLIILATFGPAFASRDDV